MYVDCCGRVFICSIWYLFDLDEQKIEEAKAECGRKRMAQEAKKLALAALLCRLAVGSGNDDQFDRQLQRTVQKQRRDNEQSIPVISGEIRDPEGK